MTPIFLSAAGILVSLLETTLKQASPVYTQYLMLAECSQSIGGAGLLYGRNDFEERNETYEVQLYLPGWIAIGDDGGGTAILMKLDRSDAVFFCGQGALGSLEPEPLANSFKLWLSNNCPIPWDAEDDDVEYEN